MSNLTSEQNGNVMIVKRSFDAPRELLFEVYTDCKHLMKWYGGDEWPLAKCEIDFRKGGRWYYCFKMADEQPCGMAIYREILKPERIVYKDHFLDEEGEISKELPPSLITVEFHEQNGKTTVVNRWEYPTKSDLDLMLEMGAVEGLTEIWNWLHNYLKQHQTKNEE